MAVHKRYSRAPGRSHAEKSRGEKCPHPSPCHRAATIHILVWPSNPVTSGSSPETSLDLALWISARCRQSGFINNELIHVDLAEYTVRTRCFKFLYIHNVKIPTTHIIRCAKPLPVKQAKKAAPTSYFSTPSKPLSNNNKMGRRLI